MRKIDDSTRSAILKRDADRRQKLKDANERRRVGFEESMISQGFEKTTTPSGQTMYRIPQSTQASIPTGITPQPQESQPMNILSSYQRMLGSGGQQQPSFNQAGQSSMGQLEAASMRLADAASRRALAESAFGSELRRGEMGTEYGLRGQLAGVESGLRQREMGTEYGLRGQLAGVESGFRRGEMGLGSSLRQQELRSEYGLRGSLAEREADISARQQGFGGLSDLQRYTARSRNLPLSSSVYRGMQTMNFPGVGQSVVRA